MARFWHWKHWPVVLGSTAILFGIVAVVASVSNFMQGPTDEKPPNAAEWLSAISTFWGAIATAIGAIVTAGAVLIAALTYKHQVDEKNREAEDRRQQAADERSAQARTVKMTKNPGPGSAEMEVILHNFSDGHLEAVNVVSVNVEHEETKRHLLETMNPGKERRLAFPLPATGNSYASFIDAKGLTWKLYFDGRLEEQVPAQAAAL
ncbi:hypothetical protein [Arthrobacter oryzae]|uniref:hypothetical protein n=1 Tax=Arthrobacter oryzae TaxID=409290 RepID=UPI002786A699|nr:hypothetical protein [Arthrobacter oryzae]MDQ0078229.1 putative membrane protein [Arthrobacter oryzae]